MGRNWWKRAGIVLLQLLVTAAGVYYVFHEPEKRAQIFSALRHADLWWVLIGWFCYAGVESLATVRWQILLRLQGVRVGWGRTAAMIIIGLFFNLFLPGLVGGDVMRLYFIFKQTKKKTRATLSVAMDRLLGLVSILLLAAAVVGLRYDWLQRSPASARIAHLSLAILAVVFALVIGLFVLVGFDLEKKLPKRMPFREAIGESGRALQIYLRRPWPMLIALALTIVSHLGYYLTFYCAARSLHLAGGKLPAVSDILSIMPLVNTMTGLPISLGGVGVRETMFQQLLGDLAGVSVPVAVLSASLGFIIQASWGLLGGAAYLIFRPAERRSTR